MMQNVEFLTLPIGELRKNTWNSNQVSPENEAKIRRSIERNGMFKPVIVRTVPGTDGYEIIGGEHRWEQAIELGHKIITVANLGDVTEVKAKEIGIIDNARYGIDDTISLGEILKDIGTDDLQGYLPYGATDLDAIFSASDIALDDLEIDENFDQDDGNADSDDESVDKPAKTHTIQRFKISLGDAERITGLIARTQKEQSMSGADDLTNAGDALVHLLSDHLSAPSANFIEEV